MLAKRLAGKTTFVISFVLKGPSPQNKIEELFILVVSLIVFKLQHTLWRLPVRQLDLSFTCFSHWRRFCFVSGTKA